MSKPVNKAPLARALSVAAAVAAALSGTSAPAAGADDEMLGEIMVFGRGETRQVAEVGATLGTVGVVHLHRDIFGERLVEGGARAGRDCGLPGSCQ